MANNYKKLIDMKIMIVGLGLIGGTYAKILTDKGIIVNAIDINNDSIEYAKNNNIIKAGHTDVKKEYFDDIDLIIFCLYPNDFIDWIKKYRTFIKKGTLITDVTGIKSYVVDNINKELVDVCEFVPSHPMAGGERNGIKNINTEVFKNANFIVVDTNDTTKDGIERIEELGKILGFSKISILSKEKHDEMIAYLSQLTHVIAVSLMTGLYDEGLSNYTGDSFRDLTRIARINENMWSELFLLNKDYLLREMDKFEIEFNKMKEYLIKDDKESIKAMMRESTKRRNLFEKSL